MIKYFIFIFSFLFFACGGYKQSVETSTLTPSLEIESSISDCDTELCELVSVGIEEFTEESDTIKFNWIMNASIESFFTREENNIPKLKFKLRGIEAGAVKRVSYQYQKLDKMGTPIYKSDIRELIQHDGIYTIMYNVDYLGPAIANSFPEEEQNIIVKITDLNNHSYESKLSFRVKALNIEAINISREESTNSLDYYTSFMPDADGVFLIDSFNITNTQDRTLNISGNINLSNSTNAIVSITNREQRVSNLGRPDEYFPRDIFGWDTINSEYITYRKVKADSYYFLKILRGDHLENIDFESDASGNIVLNSLSINPNEEIKLLVFSRVNIDSNLLGSHGSKMFYIGESFYNNIADPISCNYFYTFLPYEGTSSLARGVYYLTKGVDLKTLERYLYPECGEPDLNKTLREEYMSENTVNLQGRKHTLSTNVDLTVKEEAYLGEGFQNINKAFEMIEAVDGLYDESLINDDYIYTGYVI